VTRAVPSPKAQRSTALEFPSNPAVLHDQAEATEVSDSRDGVATHAAKTSGASTTTIRIANIPR
jgi:hypothetical protein